MEESKFKVGDCAQLIHGTDRMTVAKVEWSPLEGVYQIQCNWSNAKTGKPEQKNFVEGALKHCGNKANQEDIDKLKDEIMPKRR